MKSHKEKCFLIKTIHVLVVKTCWFIWSKVSCSYPLNQLIKRDPLNNNLHNIPKEQVQNLRSKMFYSSRNYRTEKKINQS